MEGDRKERRKGSRMVKRRRKGRKVRRKRKKNT